MNCQWQSLVCRVEAGVLNMFADEDDKEEGGGDVKRERSPQYTVQLRGCDVRAGPDTDGSHRVTLSMLGDQVAVLEVRATTGSFESFPTVVSSLVCFLLQVSSSEEKQRWVKLLQDGAANHSHHDNTQGPTGGALR